MNITQDNYIDHFGKDNVVFLAAESSNILNGQLIYVNNTKHTVFPKIVEGLKICRFHCKLVEHEILILKKKQWLKEMMYST